MSKTLWYLVAYATIRLWRDPLQKVAEWLYYHRFYRESEATLRLSSAPALWFIVDARSHGYGQAMMEVMKDERN